MLWLDIVRSPYAHATIKSIDATEALKIPGVLAVITGADLEKAGLHWMPTLAGDRQMVLPTTTVMYQAQEVAAVVATTRYIAADGVGRGRGRVRAAAGHRRPDEGARAGRVRAAAGSGGGQEEQPHLALGIGRRAPRPTRPSPAPTVTVTEDIYIPRIHVASIETCGCVADWDAVRGQLTLHMTSQAPHAIRTVLALVSRACPSRTSGSRPTTSAAGSAAKCRSTRATCWRSSPA